MSKHGHSGLVRHRFCPRVGWFLLLAGLPSFGYAQAPPLTVSPLPTAENPALAAVADLMAGASRTLSLKQCTELALQNPYSTIRFAASQDKAERSMDLARANMRPMVETQGKVNISSVRDLLSTQDAYEFAGERARVGLALSYPLYDAGARRDELRIAEVGRSTSLDSLVSDQYAILDRISVLYFEVLRGQRAVTDGSLEMQIVQEHLTAAQTRLQVGTATKEDVLAAQGQLSSAEAAQGQRIFQLTEARIRFANLCNLPPGERPAVVPPTPPLALTQSLSQLQALALQNSLEHNRLIREAQTARLQLSLINAQNSPQVGITVGTGFVLRERNFSNSGGSQVRPYAVVGIDLKVPLFTQPHVRAQRRNQKDEILLRDLAVQQNERQISEDVEVNLLAYQSRTTEIAANEAAVADAEAAEHLAEERYQVGKATQTDVAIALTRLAASRTSFSTLNDSRDIAIQQLRWAVGLDKPGVGIKTLKQAVLEAPSGLVPLSDRP